MVVMEEVRSRPELSKTEENNWSSNSRYKIPRSASVQDRKIWVLSNGTWELKDGAEDYLWPIVDTVHGQKKVAQVQWNFNTNQRGNKLEGVGIRAKLPSDVIAPNININMQQTVLDDSKAMQLGKYAPYIDMNMQRTVLDDPKATQLSKDAPNININMQRTVLDGSKAMQLSKKMPARRSGKSRTSANTNRAKGSKSTTLLQRTNSASPQYGSYITLQSVLCKWLVWFVCICISGLVMRYFKPKVFETMIENPINWIFIATPMVCYAFFTARGKSNTEDVFSGASDSKLESLGLKEMYAPNYQGTQDKMSNSKTLLLVL